MSILGAMDWRLNYTVQPTTSGLLFLTGHMHRMQVTEPLENSENIAKFRMQVTKCVLQEESLCALHHLIVASYTDVGEKETLFFVRRRHPAAVALACLATTLALAKNARQSMPLADRVQLLRDVAAALGMADLEEDADMLLYPADDKHREPFLEAMRYIALVMWEAQPDDDDE